MSFSRNRDALRGQFLENCEVWNKTHRIFGSQIASRVDESEKALAGWEGLSVSRTVIDVGAGSGLMTLPLLWLKPEVSVVWVEPNKKKASFLSWFKLSLPGSVSSKIVVIAEALELVSRETVSTWPEPIALVARAFSGEKTLHETVSSSAFVGLPVWVFDQKNNENTLKRLLF